MPINPRHVGTFTFVDRSNETSSMQFDFPPITVGTLPAFLTDFGSLRAATQAISMGTLTRDRWSGDVTAYNAILPTNPNAQRERKFLFIYQDDTTFVRGRIEVPVADLSLPNLFPAGATDEIDLAQPDIAAWVTAFELLARSPDGNTITVLHGYAVGRNL